MTDDIGLISDSGKEGIRKPLHDIMPTLIEFRDFPERVGHVRDWQKIVTTVRILQDTLAKYRTALEFYAAEENYDDAGTPFYYISPDQFNNPNGRKDDKGDTAREALEE